MTGSAGFVGRHICRELYDRGWAIREIDVVQPPGPLANYDVRKYFRESTDVYDLVVHCAYEVGGRTHIDGKNLALAHNLEMDALLFDWAVRTEQKAVLYFSSCAAYPTWISDSRGRAAERHMRFEPDTESEDPWDTIPFDNYGWAKQTGERLGRAAADLGLRVHTVRPFSGYGAGQSLDYPFPSIVRRALQGDLSVWGPPGQFRDWIHISDIVAASIAVYEADYRSPVNLCTGVATEFGRFAQLAFSISHPGENWMPPVFYDPEKPTGSLYRVGDPTLMNSMYTAKISLEDGIREAIEQL